MQKQFLLGDEGIVFAQLRRYNYPQHLLWDKRDSLHCQLSKLESNQLAWSYSVSIGLRFCTWTGLRTVGFFSFLFLLLLSAWLVLKNGVRKKNKVRQTVRAASWRQRFWTFIWCGQKTVNRPPNKERNVKKKKKIEFCQTWNLWTLSTHTVLATGTTLKCK